jgi:hypothetical protein
MIDQRDPVGHARDADLERLTERCCEERRPLAPAGSAARPTDEGTPALTGESLTSDSGENIGQPGRAVRAKRLPRS